ncbi:MAG: hypothetical protein H0S71_00120 [Methanococcus maripaludis]|uniref:Uncharacterized protein n=1 Tax=Methanococcus maripaludis TaxID=39152 RepID=A0A8T3W4A2_METMI|nr:hypothetical protein [Methanococcus maripaludis]
MGLLNSLGFKNKSDSPGKVGPENTEEIENDENEDETPGTFNVIRKVKKKKEEYNAEREAYDSLAPYLCRQKLLIWHNGSGAKVFGYPHAVIPDEGTYKILYKNKATDWLEDLIITIKSTIFNYKRHYAVVYAPKSCVDVSEDIIMFFVKYAVPLEADDPRQRVSWIVERKRAEAYEVMVENLLSEDIPNLVDAALYINPTMKMYKGSEKESSRKSTKEKSFEGGEFSFDNAINRMKNEMM